MGMQVCKVCEHAYWTTYGKARCPRCLERAAIARRKENKLKARITKCAMCGLSFVPCRSGAKYCSDRCRQAAYRQRNS